VDASFIAGELGSQKVSNIVMLGAASDRLGISPESLHKSIVVLFGRKGEEVVNLNISALEAGRNAVS
jgi:indolepyruvate ferredoxin oxidoreductase beta subunit